VPGRGLRAGHDAGDIGIFTGAGGRAGIRTAPVLLAPSHLLLSFLEARTLARALVLRRTGLLHGASRFKCPHRTFVTLSDTVAEGKPAGNLNGKRSGRP